IQRVRPEDIVSADFRRRFFDEPGIVERLSLIQRGAGGWGGLNVVRHTSEGPFSEREIDGIAALARLALPMLRVARPAWTARGSLTATQLAERFARRWPG